MKIGTVTYHRANNYGAELQAYALFKYLKNLGYDVEIVDYWPKYHSRIYSVFGFILNYLHSIRRIKNILRFPIVLFLCIKIVIKNRRYSKFRSNYMIIGPKEGMASYDAVFYGSDTIWNNKIANGFDPVYWGDKVIKSTYKFSYAPSMGNVIDTEDTYLFCKKMLPNFRRISVRESNLIEKFKEWGWNDVVQVGDPAFLLSKEQWSELIPSSKNEEDYILIYNLEESAVATKIAEELSSKTNLRIIKLTGYVQKTLKKNVIDTAGPIEFLDLIKNAKYIVTSSFHGVAFSIIFEKQFCFHSNNETERISSILSLCGLSDRFVANEHVDIFSKEIDYKEVKNKLDVIRSSSFSYLDNCLKIASKDERNM